MRVAVIQHIVRVARDRYNHFGIGRCDRQRAFFLLDSVVVFVELFTLRKGDRVRNAADIRDRSRRLDIRRFAFSKAVARNLHNRLCQRRAVVGLAGRFGGQHHAALADRQRSRIRLRNDIFLRRVNLANSTFRKRDRIFAGIRSLPARFGNIVKGNVLRAGVARFNRLLVSIISLLVAVRRQLDVLIIVEIDLVRSRPNRDLLGIIRYRRVAIGPDGGFRHLFPEHLACNGLGIRNLSGRPVPVVIHRVAQVDSRRVIEVKNVLVIANRERRFLTRYQRVARNLGGRGHSLAERRSSSYRLCNFSRCFFQIIVYRVVSIHRPHVFIIELYIFYRFVKIYLGVQIRIAFPFCF